MIPVIWAKIHQALLSQFFINKVPVQRYDSSLSIGESYPWCPKLDPHCIYIENCSLSLHTMRDMVGDVE